MCCMRPISCGGSTEIFLASGTRKSGRRFQEEGREGKAKEGKETPGTEMGEMGTERKMHLSPFPE